YSQDRRRAGEAAAAAAGGAARASRRWARPGASAAAARRRGQRRERCRAHARLRARLLHALRDPARARGGVRRVPGADLLLIGGMETSRRPAPGAAPRSRLRSAETMILLQDAVHVEPEAALSLGSIAWRLGLAFFLVAANGFFVA